jgi:hypothetical protein
MDRLKELPPDDMFEAVAHVGRLKHEFLFAQKRPLAFESDQEKLAKALLDTARVECGLPPEQDQENYWSLKNYLELSELWFDYKTDENGKVTWTDKVDWVKEAEPRD